MSLHARFDVCLLWLSFKCKSFAIQIQQALPNVILLILTDNSCNVVYMRVIVKLLVFRLYYIGSHSLCMVCKEQQRQQKQKKHQGLILT